MSAGSRGSQGLAPSGGCYFSWIASVLIVMATTSCAHSSPPLHIGENKRGAGDAGAELRPKTTAPSSSEGACGRRCESLMRSIALIRKDRSRWHLGERLSRAEQLFALADLAEREYTFVVYCEAANEEERRRLRDTAIRMYRQVEMEGVLSDIREKARDRIAGLERNQSPGFERCEKLGEGPSQRNSSRSGVGKCTEALRSAGEAAELEIGQAKEVHDLEDIAGDRRAEIIFRLGELYEAKAAYLEYCAGRSAEAALVRRNAAELYRKVAAEHSSWKRASDANERSLRLLGDGP